MAELSLTKADFIKAGSDLSGIDHRGKAKTFVVLLFLGIAGYFALPYLVTMAWDVTQIGIAAVACIALWIIIQVFYKNIDIFISAITKFLLGWYVEFDEFGLQEMQIKQAAKDAEQMLVEKAKIEGQYNKLNEELNHKKDAINLNIEAAKMARTPEEAEDCQAEIVRANNYVEMIGPMVQDLDTMNHFLADTYKIIGRKIKNAMADLQANKELFYAVSAGAAAVLAGKKAMFGDARLNENAAFAKEEVKKRIALSIGQMRTTMGVLTEATSKQNLQDAAAIKVAMNKIRAINDTAGDGPLTIPVPVSNTFTGVPVTASKYNAFFGEK